MNGEMGFSYGEPLEKCLRSIKFHPAILIYVLSDNSADALVSLQEGLDFTSGELIVNYRSQGNPTQPETEKEWGKLN